MPLNRQSTTPLYIQLYQQMRDDYDATQANHQLWSIRKWHKIWEFPRPLSNKLTISC